MIKRMDLSGDWAFALDADKTGIEQGVFRSLQIRLHFPVRLRLPKRELLLTRKKSVF
jgi:hypothetical protein